MIDQKYLRQFPSCRDCGKPTLDKKRKLCPACLKLSAERHRIKAREANRERRKTGIRKTDIPRKCETENCNEMVTGRKRFCAKHAKRKYTSSAREPEILPQTTGYDWLRNFDGWLKSGKSYADFQKGEWLNAASQIHTHTA